MALITKYGTIWGAIPTTAGRVFWVAPTSPYLVEGRAYDRSDANDGLSPERALATINRATALATANAGDVVVMLPGTHDLTAVATLNVAGVTYMGLPSGAGNRMRQKTTVQTTTANAALNVSAADIEIGYLNVLPSVARVGVTFSAAASRLYIHDCSFDMYSQASASTSTLGIDATGAAAQVLIERCIFQSAGAQGVAVDLTATLDSLIQDCEFMSRSGVWAAALSMGAATARLRVHRCNFSAAGTTATITAGIDGTGFDIVGGAIISDCRFQGAGAGATRASAAILKAVDNFSNSLLDLTECYYGSCDITTSCTSVAVTLIT